MVGFTSSQIFFILIHTRCAPRHYSSHLGRTYRGVDTSNKFRLGRMVLLLFVWHVPDMPDGILDMLDSMPDGIPDRMPDGPDGPDDLLDILNGFCSFRPAHMAWPALAWSAPPVWYLSICSLILLNWIPLNPGAPPPHMRRSAEDGGMWLETFIRSSLLGGLPGERNFI